jgi:hypothetical protein
MNYKPVEHLARSLNDSVTFAADVRLAMLEREGEHNLFTTVAKWDWSCGGFAASFYPVMPYPLAHPAAILGLWCFCPQYLSFPGRIILVRSYSEPWFNQ